MTAIQVCSPRMSVVIPNYNHGHLIAEALSAISLQATPPFEVLVVDDGSTDGSMACLQSLATDMPCCGCIVIWKTAASMPPAIPASRS